MNIESSRLCENVFAKIGVNVPIIDGGIFAICEVYHTYERRRGRRK